MNHLIFYRDHSCWKRSCLISHHRIALRTARQLGRRRRVRDHFPQLTFHHRIIALGLPQAYIHEFWIKSSSRKGCLTPPNKVQIGIDFSRACPEPDPEPIRGQRQSMPMRHPKQLWWISLSAFPMFLFLARRGNLACPIHSLLKQGHTAYIEFRNLA